MLEHLLCPKCRAEYTDTAFNFVQDEFSGNTSRIMFDTFECGSEFYGITMGLKQTDKCRTREVEQLAIDRLERILQLEEALRTVRCAFAHKYNDREIAIIDHCIGKREEVDFDNPIIDTFYAEGEIHIPIQHKSRVLKALNIKWCGKEGIPLDEHATPEHQRATGNLLGHRSVQVLVDVRKSGDWIIRGAK